jgi:pimeloyl-ACP methyl ester carboxylesterase
MIASWNLGIAHQERIASVVTYIQRHRVKDVILVGHSFGGSVIQKVTEAVPDLIRRTAFLDALIIEDNQCVFDNLPADYVALLSRCT